MPPEDLRATRANRVFQTDEMRIRLENAVMDKNKGSLGWLLYKIADRERMALFHPFSIGDPRGRAAGRASRPLQLDLPG